MLTKNVESLAPETRFICILASPRTGSTLLFSLLWNCTGLNLKYELFHPKWAHSVTSLDRQVLSSRVGNDLGTDETLCAWRTMHPGKTLDTLYESGGKKPIIFKIFPDHLSYEHLRDGIFSRDDVGYIFLRRRPIESYISEVKVRKFNAFHTIDTTSFRPELKAGSFVKWAAKIQEWNDWLESELAVTNRRCARLTYEKDIGLPDTYAALSKVVHAIGYAGLTCTLKDVGFVSSMKRQDQEPCYQNRISNWRQFASALRTNPDHARLLEWAETNSG